MRQRSKKAVHTECVSCSIGPIVHLVSCPFSWYFVYSISSFLFPLFFSCFIVFIFRCFSPLLCFPVYLSLHRSHSSTTSCLCLRFSRCSLRSHHHMFPLSLSISAYHFRSFFVLFCAPSFLAYLFIFPHFLHFHTHVLSPSSIPLSINCFNHSILSALFLLTPPSNANTYLMCRCNFVFQLFVPSVCLLCEW